MNQLLLRKQVEQFLIEDIGMGDRTSGVIFSQNEKGEAQFHMKQAGVLAGSKIIQTVYSLLNSEIKTSLTRKDGDFVKASEAIATVRGPLQDVLAGERVILNLLQRMSGIATLTSKAVSMLDSSHTRICDTRKTTPGLRMLEKYAVTCGGGFNHRLSLSDGVLIKDNHIGFAGSITAAVNRVREQLGHMVKIEVETETEEQVREAIQAGVDIIMFDNRTPEEIKKFIKLVPPEIITEASGNITLDSLSAYRHTGVDYISLGFLTHSVKAIDISVTI